MLSRGDATPVSGKRSPSCRCWTNGGEENADQERSIQKGGGRGGVPPVSGGGKGGPALTITSPERGGKKGEPCSREEKKEKDDRCRPENFLCRRVQEKEGGGQVWAGDKGRERDVPVISEGGGESGGGRVGVEGRIEGREKSVEGVSKEKGEKGW